MKRNIVVIGGMMMMIIMVVGEGIEEIMIVKMMTLWIVINTLKGIIAIDITIVVAITIIKVEGHLPKKFLMILTTEDIIENDLSTTKGEIVDQGH